MNRRFYLEMAAAGLRFPIGAHLVLHEQPESEALLEDGPGLGRVVAEAARRYRSPLALPLMDLTVEKADLAGMLGVAADQAEHYHLPEGASQELIEQVEARLADPPTPRMRANGQAIEHIARETDLTPVGMAIGPFSLMTKLLSDPITPVFLAGSDVRGEDDPEVRAVEIALELAVRVISRSIRLQVRAGAKAVCLCEPAANQVFISPNQMDQGSDVFERLVMRPNRRIKDLLDQLQADLIFHDCGELTEAMLRQFTTLDPALLSLGSSRSLWEDARLVPPTTVLFGNLPTKKFYSDAEVSLERVEEMTRELVRRMKSVGHPLIVGSECDVLSVPGREATIKAKVQRMLTCAC